jgi:hypothetical protein
VTCERRVFAPSPLLSIPHAEIAFQSPNAASHPSLTNYISTPSNATIVAPICCAFQSEKPNDFYARAISLPNTLFPTPKPS